MGLVRVVCGRLQCEATSLKRDRAGGRTRGADNGDNDGMSMEHDTVIEDTRNWMVKAVIGLNLCPFAKGVHVKNQVRYRVSDASGNPQPGDREAVEVATQEDPQGWTCVPPPTPC